MPLLRREFAVTTPVRRATVYICGLGQFEFHINGQKIGDDLLEPGWTNYRKTCLYVTRDITQQIAQGPNAVAVLLGNGMYNVPDEPGRFAKFKASFGDPVLIAQIEIEYADGSRQTIATDESWKVTRGPILFSSTYGGEDYDARLEQPGWDQPHFDDGPVKVEGLVGRPSWTNAVIQPGPGGTLRGATCSAPPIRVAKRVHARSKSHRSRVPPGVWVYDFGQNCSLIPKITSFGSPGNRDATVKLTPGELVGDVGTVIQQWASSSRGCNFTYSPYTLTRH